MDLEGEICRIIFSVDKSQTRRGDSRGSLHSAGRQLAWQAKYALIAQETRICRGQSNQFPFQVTILVFPRLAQMYFSAGRRSICSAAQSPASHLATGGRKYISSFDLQLLPDFTTPNKLPSVKRSNQSLTPLNPSSWVSDGHCRVFGKKMDLVVIFIWILAVRTTSILPTPPQ